MRTKLVLGLLFAVAAMLFLIVPAATATNGSNTVPTTPQFDPMQTNVPYLAWNGEEVRLVKCYRADDTVLAQPDSVLQSALKAEFKVLDWTGSPAAFASGDPIEQNTVAVYHDKGGLCVRTDAVSLKPGLATIEMDVTLDFTKLGLSGLDGLVVMPKHVFLAAWMTPLVPAIHEMSNADLTALSANQDLGKYGQVVALLHDNYSADSPTAAPTQGVMLGDPAGDGKYLPITDSAGVNHLYDGLVSVHVKGTFPNGMGGLWTMPDDWAALAARYESDSMSTTGHDPGYWDIHNALSWDPRALLQDVLYPSVNGPFDPVFTYTLLNDGVLDQGDAPMPALRIDFQIAAGGVGGFDAASKALIYTKDATVPFGGLAADGTNTSYAPYYNQWIPATSRDWTGASGIDGPATGNNFLGFLNGGGLYPNWATLAPQVNDPLRAGNPNTCYDELGNTRVSPEDVPDTVTVYTDEHGEAIVAYNPDKGFYFESDSNGLCDLGQNVPVDATGSTPSTPVLLGTSAVTATAYYPYKPAGLPLGLVSNTLTKSVYGDPAKFLRCIPKDSRTDVMFCVEVIRDLYGNPVSGAKVQFTAQPGAKLVPASLKLGGFDTTGQTYWGTPDNTTVYVKTNAMGQAGVEVVSTLKGQVDLLAENIDTRNGGLGITRDACITYTGTGVPTATYAAGGCAAGGSGSGTVTPPPVTPPPVAPPASVVLPTQVKPASPAVVKPTVKTKLLSAKLVVTKHARYVQVRVQSAKQTATIKVTLIGKHGKVLRAVTRKVAANKLVRVPNLTLGKSVLRVRVVLVR